MYVYVYKQDTHCCTVPIVSSAGFPPWIDHGLELCLHHYDMYQLCRGGDIMESSFSKLSQPTPLSTQANPSLYAAHRPSNYLSSM